jgi:hypothetical protein
MGLGSALVILMKNFYRNIFTCTSRKVGNGLTISKTGFPRPSFDYNRLMFTPEVFVGGVSVTNATEGAPATTQRVALYDETYGRT